MQRVSNESVGNEPFSPEDTFYRVAVKGKYKKNGDVLPRAFAPSSDGSGISVDWAARSTLEETASRWFHLPPTLTPFVVASVTAASIRECGQGIQHAPKPENHAHCLIVGDISQRDSSGDLVRVKLARLARIVYTSADRERP